MHSFNFFGSLTRLNLIGRDRTNSKSQKSKDCSDTGSEISEATTKQQFYVKNPHITKEKGKNDEESSRRVENSDKNALQTKDTTKEQEQKDKESKSRRGENSDKSALQTKDITKEQERKDKESNNSDKGALNTKEQDTDTVVIDVAVGENISNVPTKEKVLDEDEEAETRDKFEVHNTTFYKVLTKSFYDHNLEILHPFKKKDDALKSSTKRVKKSTRTLRERKMVISSPLNFQRVENEQTMILRREAENIRLETLKKSVSCDNLLMDVDNEDFSDETRLVVLEKGKLEFSSMNDLTYASGTSDDSIGESSKNKDTISNVVEERFCETCGHFHGILVAEEERLEPSVKSRDNEVQSVSEEDIDKIVEEYYKSSNLVTMRNMAQSTPELLKSINQFPKERIERPTENRFPLDDENVEIRRKPSIRSNRISKTTDFDFGRRRQEIPVSPKNFDIRGIVKFQLPNNTCIVKLNEEYVAYENENFYRINEKTKSKVLLVPNVIIKLARYTKSKESKEVELRDNQNASYLLYFHTIKNAKQFMDNEKIQVYVSDNKTTIKKTLLRFLGKRSSREILEKKGIYKNEPIFGNTLRDIYNKSAAYSPVPSFIYRVIDLIEKPENIKSLGLYRTSGNLATIQKIRFEVDNGRLDILNQFSKDPDVLTGSLKLFFRELKEPLIPCDVCEKLMGITKSDPKQIPSRDHQKIRSTLVKHLHEANLETFAVVMRHLLEVIKYKEHNKMDAYNLAVCWGPSMIFSVHGANASPTIELSKDIVTQSHDATRLVDFLLGYYELYPSELGAITKRPESLTEKILTLKRQESRDSVESSDSSKSQKKSSSNLSLSVDEITKKLIDMIDPHLSSEGIYKKPGSVEKTNKIIKKLNKKKINDLDKYKTDVYDLTDALKRYLSEQECLVTKDIISSVLKYTNGNTHNYLEPITRRKVVSIIEETPKKDTLIYLLRHLAKVIDHQSQHKVSKSDIVNVWTCVLNLQKKCHVSNEDFDKFLTVAIEVFNDNLPDVVRSSFNNNGSSPNRNDIMGEVVKQIKHQQERDRNSRYDNVDCDATGEASILDDGKTEQTKL